MKGKAFFESLFIIFKSILRILILIQPLHKDDFQFYSKNNLMKIKGGALFPSKQYEIWVSTIYMNLVYSQKVRITILNFDILPVVLIE